MNTFKRAFSLLFLALIAAYSTSYAVSYKTEFRDVNAFSGIKVATGIDLYLRAGHSENLKVIADQEVIDRVKSEVKNGILHLYVEKTGWRNRNHYGSVKIYVAVEGLAALDASSGSDVRSENMLQGDELEVNASSGSDVDLEVVYRTLSVSASSGSDAKISGKTKYLTATASSGSDIDAGNLKAQFCTATASSGADILVNVSEKLDAKASSGADIDYRGNPADVNSNESSGGDVTKK